MKPHQKANLLAAMTVPILLRDNIRAMPDRRVLPSMKAGIKTTLASRLKEARETVDAHYPVALTQVQLAGIVGCKRQNLSSLETGAHENLGADLAISIADTLKVSIRWLVRGDPLRHYVRLSKAEEAALEDFRALPPALQKHFVESVRALAALQPTIDNPFPLAPRPPITKK